MVVENIHFTKETVTCANVKFVRFKGCRFSGKGAVRVIDESHVLFENCAFEDCGIYGVTVEEGARITLLNCTFQNCKFGVLVFERGSADITHCTFSHNNMAVYTKPKTKEINFLNCSFCGGDGTSVILTEGIRASAKGCLWQGCKYEAIRLEGPKRATLFVEACVMTGCLFGVGAVIGKMDITILNSEFSHMAYHAIHLSSSVTGKADIAGCRFSHNRRDIANLCGVHCPVTIDGQLQRQDDMYQRMGESLPELLELNTSLGDVGYEWRTAFAVTRAAKKVGTGAVYCEDWNPSTLSFVCVASAKMCATARKTAK